MPIGTTHSDGYRDEGQCTKAIKLLQTSYMICVLGVENLSSW